MPSENHEFDDTKIIDKGGWESLKNSSDYKIGGKVLESVNFHNRHQNVTRKALEAAKYYNEKLSGTNGERWNQAYLMRLDTMIKKGGREYEKKLWDYTAQKLIIQPEEVSNEYWESYARYLRDEGFGDYIISDYDKETQIKELQREQHVSLEPWINYLSDDNNIYPTWFKIYTLDGISKMTKNYDTSKKMFAKRGKGDIQPYPKLNPSVLGKVYDTVAEFYDLPNNDLSHTGQNRDAELSAIVKSGNFNKLYSKILSETKEVIEVPERAEEVHGEWVEYTLGDEDKIAEAAEGTPWCVASPRVARGYLCYGRYVGEYGDSDDDYSEDGGENKAKFLFFHLKNEAGALSENACASIRLNPYGKVEEISGLLEGQALNDSLVQIVEEKVKTLPGGERFLQAFADKKELIRLDRMMQNGITDFSQDDINFIFETKRKIVTLDTYNKRDIRQRELKAYLFNRENWPEGLKVDGDLDLRGTKIESLPEGLKVGGRLDLHGTKIESLPEGLKVGGSLDLGRTKIESLPEGLEVGRSLNLSCTNVKGLPEGLKVHGSLNLYGTKIESLPEGLEVGGRLNLHGTKIESLPEGLKVGWDLDLGHTKIESLPEGLEVGRDLDLSGTKIESLPEGLKVGRHLNLHGTKIESLPEGLKVGGGLDLGYTNVKGLPEGLKVRGGLNLSGTKIESLPEGLKVGGSLDLSGTNVKSLPEGLEVGRDLDLSGTKIESLPEGLKVGGRIFR